MLALQGAFLNQSPSPLAASSSIFTIASNTIVQYIFSSLYIFRNPLSLHVAMEQIGTRRNAWPAGPKQGFLELLSPPSSARVPFHPRLTPSDDSLSEFGQHLLAGLHDPKARSEIKDLHTALATELSQLNQYAINLAIQDLARESAQELARSLVARLRAKVADQVQTRKSVASDQMKSFDVATVGTSNQDLLTGKLHGDKSFVYAAIRSGMAPEGVKKEVPDSQTCQSPNLVPPGDLSTIEAAEKSGQPEDQAISRPSVNSTVENGVSRLPLYDFIIFAGEPLFPAFRSLRDANILPQVL